MEFELKYNLSEELKYRFVNAFSFSSLEDMKNQYFKIFKEQEKARGYGLNTFVRPVLDNYEILENENIQLEGDEEEFSLELLSEIQDSIDEIGQETYEGEEEYEAEPVIPTKVIFEEPEIKEEPVKRENPYAEFESLIKGYSKPDESPKPTEKPVIKPKKQEKFYSSVIDFIKDNPNCSVSEAGKHFSKKEIQKQIKLGKIFLRRGKLSV